MRLTVQALDRLVVQVSDVEASAKWHERVLGIPGARPGARGALMSVYCRDPDGSLIEIASDLDG